MIATDGMLNRLLAGAFIALLGVESQSTPPRVLQVQQWLEAVNDHEPAVWDAAAETVSSWSTPELESLFPYVKALAELVGTDEIKPGWGVFTAAEREQLKGLAAQIRRPDINNIMKRGALLHSDIAMMAQMDSTPVSDSPPRRPANASRLGARFSVPRRTTVLADDGRYEGLGREAIHWEFGRMLLDAVRPSPSLDGMARLWYRAIAAYFAERYLLAPALHHLERALELFPEDPDLLLDRGCLHETFAAPRIQAVVQTTTLPNRGRILVASASSNLRDAERYFRQALDRKPNMTEARVRLARVLVLRERPGRARTELQRAIAETKDAVLLYYSQLFLADAEQALGNFDAAREAYQRAAAFYPRAQSPYLGLSHLARRQGDRPGAHRAIQQVLSLSADEREREDPWWRYYEGTGPNAARLLSELDALFRG